MKSKEHGILMRKFSDPKPTPAYPAHISHLCRIFPFDRGDVDDAAIHADHDIAVLNVDL